MIGGHTSGFLCNGMVQSSLPLRMRRHILQQIFPKNMGTPSLIAPRNIKYKCLQVLLPNILLSSKKVNKMHGLLLKVIKSYTELHWKLQTSTIKANATLGLVCIHQIASFFHINATCIISRNSTISGHSSYLKWRRRCRCRCRWRWRWRFFRSLQCIRLTQDGLCLWTIFRQPLIRY